jgi:hypothetical protein
MAKTSDALKIIEKINRTDPDLQGMVALAFINAKVAQLNLRSKDQGGINAATAG